MSLRPHASITHSVKDDADSRLSAVLSIGKALSFAAGVPTKLSRLSLQNAGAETGPKVSKGKKGRVWDSTPIQRAWLEKHWKNDTWRTFADLPAAPKNGGLDVPGRKAWNRVLLKDSEPGFDKAEAEDLNNAKATAKMVTDAELGPAATSPVPSDSSGSSSKVVPEAFVPIPFVPKPFVFVLDPPPNPSTITPDALRDLVTKKMGGLSWKGVTDRLDEESPTWKTMPEEERKATVEQMKYTMRFAKVLKAIEDYEEKKKNANVAYDEEQAKAEEAHDLEQQKAKDEFEGKKALISKPGANFLLDEASTKTQLVRALLRFYFQKKGTKNKLRFWSHKTPGNKTQVPDVSKELDKRRKQWADGIINELLANGGNRLDFLLSLPFLVPDDGLFVTGSDPTMNYDIIPSKSSSTSTNIDDPHAMPEYAGVIKAVGSSSEACGSKIFFYVKTVQMAFTDGTMSSESPLGEDFGVLNDAKMTIAAAALTRQYDEFLGKIASYGVTQQEMFGDMNNVKDYTYGSGRFNRSLRADPSNIDPKWFWPATQSYGLAEAKERMLNIYSGLAKKGPEMTSYETFEKLALYKIHSLWRIFVVAPRLPINVPAIRAVNDPQFLPHRLAGISDESLVPGMAFLDQAFVSTAIVSPDAYFDEPLSTFFNTNTRCCMMSLTLTKGLPAIPLFVKKEQLSHYPTENEIVLPPLCQYVFRRKTTTYIDDQGDTYMYHFDVYSAF